MRTPIIAGNWKMNKTASEAVALVKDMLKLDSIDGVEKILCPPYVSLAWHNHQAGRAEYVLRRKRRLHR